MSDSIITTNDIVVLRRKRRTSLIRKSGWMFYKFMMLGWAMNMMLVPPYQVVDLIDTTFHFSWTGIAAFGALLGMVGIGLSMNKDLNFVRRWAVPLELSGLFSMAVGPFVYLLIQVNLMLSDLPDSFHARYALCWYAMAMLAVVIARVLMVAPRFHRER